MERPQPHRAFNFSAGPGCCPTQVLMEAQEELVSYDGTGMSIMEMSHRDPGGPVQNMIEGATRKMREMMKVPDNYHILWMHGGGHGQFAAVPLNLGFTGKADYVHTGMWSARGASEAKKYLDVQTIGPFETHIPPMSQWGYRKDADYLYMCLNETVSGIEVLEDLEVPKDAPPLVVDATSTLLSRPIDISKYGIIFAASGKNLGPAGVTCVIVRADLLEKPAHEFCPSILDYRCLAFSAMPNIYNTPPVFQLYMVEKILDWHAQRGGMEGIERRAKDRAEKLYELIDNSGGFYVNKVRKDFRSRMHVCFQIHTNGSCNEDLQKKFSKEAEKVGILQLFNNPSFSPVSGLRISLYNGLEDDAVKAVGIFLQEFAQKHTANDKTDLQTLAVAPMHTPAIVA